MRSISFFILLLHISSCKAQKQRIENDSMQEGVFITYFSDSLRNHQVTLRNNELYLETFPMGLFPSIDFTFRLHKVNNSIFQAVAENCILPEYPDDNTLVILSFCNKKIKVISKDEFLLIENNKPYFRKSFIDSLTNSELMFSINGKLKKRVELTDADSLVAKKAKRKQVKWWKGKDAYDRYGAIGLYGVFEIKLR